MEKVCSECLDYAVKGNDEFMLDGCVVKAATHCALRASRKGQRNTEGEKGRGVVARTVGML